MLLREFFTSPKKIILEGGNLVIGDAQADRIDSNTRSQVVPIIDAALNAINSKFKNFNNNIPLWMPSLLNSKQFLAGSSFHFFNRLKISDADFARVKRTVGDIDTQVDKNMGDQVRKWLGSMQPGTQIGPAQFAGMDDKDPAQVLTLWKFPAIVVTDTQGNENPITIQIDLELKQFNQGAPTKWSQFSASSSWEDLSAGIKGVFHKWIIRSLTGLTTETFLLRKIGVKKTKETPTTDNMISFAVKSKEGGGLRQKYQPVVDPATGEQEVKQGLPVYTELPTSGYEQDLEKMFLTIFGDRLSEKQIKQVEPMFWSFIGIVQLMKKYLNPEEQQQVANAFNEIVFGKGAQRLYKDNSQQDLQEKNVAVNKMYEILGFKPPAELQTMIADYTAGFKGQPAPVTEQENSEIKPQFRVGMPHLSELKPLDFLDLVDELKDKGGRFVLQNIKLNEKIDGFGGRFGKDQSGNPFMGTSNSPPRYEKGFVAHQEKKAKEDGIELSQEKREKSQKFDDLFDEMMGAIKIVDQKLGPEFLLDKQVICEVLFLPFNQSTEPGKLKIVGIEYDNVPQGVELVLVPFRVVQASTGANLPEADEIISSITNIGRAGPVMFLNNQLTQKEGLDVTEIINVLDNIDELKRIISNTVGKKDRASLQLRREVEEKLKPVQLELERAIDNDPNIVGKNMLGSDYEGIVINSRLGPVKVTSRKQKNIIANKQAALAGARERKKLQPTPTQPEPLSEVMLNRPRTAVVAIGSFIGHKGHQELWKNTVKKAEKFGGDPYLFIGNAQGKDDPIPPNIKEKVWHALYPQFANNISTTIKGGSLFQKIKHELINPVKGKPPKYDNIIIMVGEDRAGMATMATELMNSVNKFQGYENVKVSLEATPRNTGMSGTALRNILKDKTKSDEEKFNFWNDAYNGGNFSAKKLSPKWITFLMDVTKKGMMNEELLEDLNELLNQLETDSNVVPMSEDVEKIMSSLIKEIIQNGYK